MNERIFWVEKLNKKILVMKFNKLMMKDFINQLNVCFEFIEAQNRNDLLLLFDITDATVFGEALAESKLFAKKIQPFRKKSALIGITGAKRVILQSVLLFAGSSNQVKSFETSAQAELWLAM